MSVLKVSHNKLFTCLKKEREFSFNLIILLGLISIIPAFALGYNFVLNLYYEYGCPLLDQGITAFLMWRNDINIKVNPALVESFGTNIYFVYHFSSIFTITSIISKILSFNIITFFALYHSISHGILALSIYFTIYKLYKFNNLFDIIFGVFIAIVFSLNGIAVSSAFFPHPEMLFIPATIFFLVFLIQKKPIVAFPFFLLALTIRECSGFHLFLILSAIIFLLWTKEKKINVSFFVYAITALIASIAMLIIQKVLNSNNEVHMVNWYFGYPPFSHLSWSIIKHRLVFLLYNRGYFLAPISIILIWSLITNKKYLSLGIITFIPFFLFTFLGVSSWAAGLYYYYGNYFLLIFIWPLLALKIVHNDKTIQDMKYKVFTWYFLIVASSAFIHSPLHMNSFFQKPGVAQKHIFTRLQTALKYNNELGYLGIDNKIISLDPQIFTKEQVLELRYRTKEEAKSFFYRPSPYNEEKYFFDSIMYYNSSFQEGLIPFYILASKLPYMYQVIGTNVYLASNKLPTTMPAFQNLLIPLQGYNIQQLFNSYANQMFSNTSLGNNVHKTGTDFIVRKKSHPGLMLSSAPLRLPIGSYSISITLDMIEPPYNTTKSPVSLIVAFAHNNQVIAKKDLSVQELIDNKNKEIKLDFNVYNNLPNAYIKVTFWSYQNISLDIKNPRLLNNNM